MTDKDIIIALGDTRWLAEKIGAPVTTVSNWKERGIPWHWRGEIKQIAQRKRVSLPAEFLTRRQLAKSLAAADALTQIEAERAAGGR